MCTVLQSSTVQQHQPTDSPVKAQTTFDFISSRARSFREIAFTFVCPVEDTGADSGIPSSNVFPRLHSGSWLCKIQRKICEMLRVSQSPTLPFTLLVKFDWIVTSDANQVRHPQCARRHHTAPQRDFMKYGTDLLIAPSTAATFTASHPYLLPNAGMLWKSGTFQARTIHRSLMIEFFS